ncbi:hypothetical protein [Streptomyces capitiformicae]|uniref:Secreted protein n=1 Tax=Streptomyces capitiformicae TaxID=2014920 RepID=A0A919DGP4_9ACTN|nr:hypothetical protein [Streptomyces capitiformicae]GHE46137.1 hypothetical protein GCM10017771_66860 [Streptomyces capitiformicae]
MKMKKSITVLGIAVAGAAVAIATQGSAQAAPVKPVSAQTAVQPTAGGEAPQAILSAVTKVAQKATVHAKAVTSKSLGNISELGSLFGAPPANGVPEGGVESVDVAFDK